MIVAGLGFRKRICAAQIEQALAAALRSALLEDRQLTQLATAAAKAIEPAIIEVAAARGVPVISIPQELLESVSPRTATRSARSIAAMHVNSVAEAAALAAAGPNARLLAARIALGPVTCAFAEGDGAP